jgi:hypothetical protein
MISITIQVDPLILKTIETISKERRSTKSQVIRDAMYSVVTAWQQGSLGLQRAPACPKSFNAQLIRVLDGSLVRIDEDGVVINGAV